MPRIERRTHRELAGHRALWGRSKGERETLEEGYRGVGVGEDIKNPFLILVNRVITWSCVGVWLLTKTKEMGNGCNPTGKGPFYCTYRIGREAEPWLASGGRVVCSRR
jgi:hypothetical protein